MECVSPRVDCGPPLSSPSGIAINKNAIARAPLCNVVAVPWDLHYACARPAQGSRAVHVKCVLPPGLRARVGIFWSAAATKRESSFVTKHPDQNPKSFNPRL